MPLFNIDGAKLSSIQVWAVIIIGSGSLGISMFRENKAVSSDQGTRDAVIMQGVQIDQLAKSQKEMKDESAASNAKFEEIIDQINELKISQDKTNKDIAEIINIGQFYIKNREGLNEEQMKGIVEDMIKKNGWSFMPWIVLED